LYRAGLAAGQEVHFDLHCAVILDGAPGLYADRISLGLPLKDRGVRLHLYEAANPILPLTKRPAVRGELHGDFVRQQFLPARDHAVEQSELTEVILPQDDT